MTDPAGDITGSPQLPWAGLPASVRGAIENHLGSVVVAAVNQAGGFSLVWRRPCRKVCQRRGCASPTTTANGWPRSSTRRWVGCPHCPGSGCGGLGAGCVERLSASLTPCPWGQAPLAADQPADVTAVLIGLTGMWAESFRAPPPSAMPTIRAFQRRFHDAALGWAMCRTGWL